MALKADFIRAFAGGATIQARLDVTLEAFGMTVLFGHSGCGKTTVLRCLAGLERPDEGCIYAGDEVWFNADQGNVVPASLRNIGYVFQEAALFPHLDVKGNIAFGLRHWSKDARRKRVHELLALMGLEALEHRKPAALSGGQKQRVALARALAPRPRLVLLDEPFASLDRGAAEQLRHGLRQMLHTLEVPAILVTHDPVEALALGDRLLRMAEGRIVQEGAPAEVLSQEWGAEEETIGVVVRTRVIGRMEGLLRLSTGSAELFAPDPGGVFSDAYACIRGEGVSLEHGVSHGWEAPGEVLRHPMSPSHGTLTQRNRLAASITGIASLGALTRVRLDAGFPFEALITTWAHGDLGLTVGQRVHALVKASAIRVIPIET